MSRLLLSDLHRESKRRHHIYSSSHLQIFTHFKNAFSPAHFLGNLQYFLKRVATLYLVKYKLSKFAPIAVTQRQIIHTRTKENVVMTDDLY